MVDATGELTCTNGFYLPIEYSVAAPRLQMVIMPDTAVVRDRIRDHLAKSARKIPGDDEDWDENGDDNTLSAADDPEIPRAPYVPGAPRDPADFLQLPVLRAVCSVSGLLRAGQWEDAGGLEAARMLLLTRYDLKLGLWDLALNPVLRATVLESLPVRPAPGELAQAPANEWKRAERKAEKATARREATRRAVGEVNAVLQQELAFLGWTIDRWGRLYLPLTEKFSNWFGGPEYPFVMLRMELDKRSICIIVWHWFNRDLDINDYIEKRRGAFETVASLNGPNDRRPSPSPQASMPIWTANTGWGDAGTDWSSIAKEIAEHTKRWVKLLAPFVASSRKLRHKYLNKTH
jgi:hypothetical protein